MPDFFDEEKIRHWLFKLAIKHHTQINKLNYIFCSDEYLLDINNTYLNHNYYTDIITFPYREGEVIEGDIFISIDRVIDNANKLNDSNIESELIRVIAHGFLHLCGFKDKSDEEQTIMTSKEDEAIFLYLDSLD